MISDVQNVLLEFDDSDLEELAQVGSDFHVVRLPVSRCLVDRTSSPFGTLYPTEETCFLLCLTRLFACVYFS